MASNGRCGGNRYTDKQTDRQPLTCSLFLESFVLLVVDPAAAGAADAAVTVTVTVTLVAIVVFAVFSIVFSP